MNDTAVVAQTGISTNAFLDRDRADAVVVSCMGFRFVSQTEAAVQKAFNVTEIDLIRLAGGAKNLSSPGIKSRRRAVISDIALAIESHHVEKIILLNHQSCGKYAAEGLKWERSQSEAERAFHHQELRRAGEYARRKFPQIEILLGYTVAVGNAVVIETVSTVAD